MDKSCDFKALYYEFLHSDKNALISFYERLMLTGIYLQILEEYILEDEKLDCISQQSLL